MIKGKEILHKPVVAISNGQKLETVHDVVFDPQGNRVIGLLVEEGGWFRAAKVIPYDRVKSIGEDAVMVGSPEDVVSVRDDQRMADVMASKVNLIGMALITTGGQRLGRIADVYFDEATGVVEGYEATGGLFADLSGGRTFVPAPEDVKIGEDSAVVPESVAQAMQEQEPGGLRGALASAGESVRGGVQSVQSSVQGAYENIATATADRQVEYVTGKTAGSDLTTDDGTVLVHKGETITAEQAATARERGLLTALATSATGGAIAGAYQNAAGSVQGAYDNASDASAERGREYVVGKTASADVSRDDGLLIVGKGEVITAEQAAEAEAAGKLPALTAAATGGAVGGFLGNIRDRISEGYDNLKDATAERQKAFVVGKTTTREVRTDAGELIVPQGAVVTAVQADRAEATGKLAALTGSVELLGGETAPSADDPTSTPAVSADGPVGRRVRADVRSPSGGIVAAQGQIVTPAILERARHLGVEDALLAATASPTTQAAQNASQTASNARAAVAGGLASVSESAGGLLDRAKAWLGEKREETLAAQEEYDAASQQARIQDALGRPVNRVILAPDDSVILNVGEIVTNKAVQAAQAGGVLEMLLGSVSHATPDINPLDARPAQTGEAALPTQPHTTPTEPGKS